MVGFYFYHSDTSSELKKALLNEFDALYKKYQDQGIYAFALVLNNLLVPECTAVSTKKSLLSETENKFQYLTEEDQWNVDKWRYRTQTAEGVSPLAQKMSQYFQQLSLSSNKPSSQDRFKQSTLNFYIKAMEDVKDQVLERYNLTANKITFLLHLPDKHQIAINSLERLNPPSSNLFEAIANLKSRLITEGGTKFKLSQVDKDVLTDLGQSLEIEPYDDMEIAQQAYLLSLEPYFLETSPYIQNLINDIAAMEEGYLVITKQEIKNRIKLFNF